MNLYWKKEKKKYSPSTRAAQKMAEERTRTGYREAKLSRRRTVEGRKMKEKLL